MVTETAQGYESACAGFEIGHLAVLALRDQSSAAFNPNPAVCFTGVIVILVVN